jgi:hypothetical protein
MVSYSEGRIFDQGSDNKLLRQMFVPKIKGVV